MVKHESAYVSQGGLSSEGERYNIPASDFSAQFMRDGVYPANSERVHLCFNSRPLEGVACFELDLGSPSVAEEFFGSGLKAVEQFLHHLNGSLAGLPFPGPCSKTKRCGLPAWLCLLPGVCCLGGFCFLIADEKLHWCVRALPAPHPPSFCA